MDEADPWSHDEATFIAEDFCARQGTTAKMSDDELAVSIRAYGEQCRRAGAEAMREAVDAIADERQRQRSAEGWTAEHDDAHDSGEMLHAAVLYLWHGTDKAAPLYANDVPISWPWEARWWKPKDRRRNLVRAGALCLAEADRLARAGKHARHVYQKLALVLRELCSLPLPSAAEAASPAAGWQTIDTAPTDGRVFLGAMGEVIALTGWKESPAMGFWACSYPDDLEGCGPYIGIMVRGWRPTMWRPLPEPPSPSEEARAG